MAEAIKTIAATRIVCTFVVIYKYPPDKYFCSTMMPPGLLYVKRQNKGLYRVYGCLIRMTANVANLPFQHRFVIRAHHFADWRACANGFGHSFFFLHNVLGSLENARQVSRSDEDDGAGIRDDVVTRRDQYGADRDLLVRRHFDEPPTPGRTR